MILSVLKKPGFLPSIVFVGIASACVAAAAAAAAPQTTQTTPPAPAAQDTTQPANTSIFTRGHKKSDAKDARVVQSKDTKKELDRVKKDDLLVGQDSKLPDKQLYDKAQVAMKKGHFDVARLDLQTMLNTYPDSQYQMRAKLAIADSWYREGGTAALTQAESEYADFRVFFPNVPEAAEAQMRIGDIYFKQMDKPDRDYSKAVHAEEEYRRMLTDYPDSTLVPQAKQRLREVQEVMATREADIATYYGTRENWAAVIARDRTILDTYPLYSHMDDVLISLGDAYEAQARYIRSLTLPEAGKAKLEILYDTQAADAYRKVVLEHAAAPHVEDAKDRLAAMNLPIPVPTKEQLAQSEALENSRATYRLVDVAKSFILHTPDTVTAARIGDPTMTDPKATLAPAIVNKSKNDFALAFNAAPAPVAPAAPGTAPVTPAPAAAISPDSSAPAAPLAFVPVATADGPTSGSATTSFSNTAPAATPGGGNNLGIEIITPSARPATTLNDTPGGISAVGPRNATALPAVEAPAAAPDQPNAITAATPAAATPGANGKTKAPAFDKSDESSSKHHKKKGIKKVLEPL